MKKLFLMRVLFIIACAIFLLATDVLSQSVPYLGQTPPGNIPVRLVPDSLAANSEWQYHGTPTFSPDGNEMYYAIYRFNPGRIEIWFTECINGVWITPKKAPFSNDDYGNNNPYFSSNKDTLYFLSSRPSGPIFKVTRTNGTWSSPLSLNIRIPSGYSTGWQFSIADNGNIYAELSKNGQEDIYVWRFVSGLYRSAEKLSTICSPELDFTPFIDPAERFIIFASRRLGGLGNTDIYISKKNSDGTWETPINLGAIINSGYVISPIISRDGKYFFFEAWMPDAAGGNPYWVDANVVFNLIEEASLVTDYDGNKYKTVKIGNQTWMAENLRSTHYSDGTPISYYNYNNDSNNVPIYGRLYSWAAAMKNHLSSKTNPSNVQGIAPVGWHLPSKAEWQELATYLGGTNIAGGKMKEVGNLHWLSPNTGATNESGFASLPAGMFAFWQEFQWKDSLCAFITSTDQSVPNHPAVAGIQLSYDNEEMHIGEFHPDDALSVRCVKDNVTIDVKDEQSNPTGYNLFQNYPNPFNPSTKIKYELKTQSNVKLNITNILGENVFNAVDEIKEAGVYEYNFNAANLSSGIYFYQLNAGNFHEIKKMILLR
ncbi:MAG: T9SS type A sorting domain-containing protein [Bacteroidetes bacterium]|nr:T9SS type A sorting domain-containing protein [Bacteroidota bacterium]MBU1116307.1 T9SS type A sorting domain-containing protein [Bacteroidota bacterium]MBU1799300.1 T9SS type A sorting domain-containing protein [Bacteroidota bacterium]